MEQVLTSLDIFAGICHNLIDYTFNVGTSTVSTEMVLNAGSLGTDVIVWDESGHAATYSGYAHLPALDCACWLLCEYIHPHVAHD